MPLSQEQRLKKLNNVLRVIRDVNQLIVKEDNKRKLIEGICKNLTKERTYYNAWIALTDGKGIPENYYESKVGKKFNTLVKLLKEGKYPSCWKEAMSSTETIVKKDPKKECQECLLSKNYAGKRAMIKRLEYNGKIYGILSASLPLKYLDEEESALFFEVAGDISYALHNIEQKELQKKTRELLNEFTERYKLAIEGAGLGTWDWDIRTNEVKFNKIWAKMKGYSLEEIEPRLSSWEKLVHPEDMPGVQKKLNAHLKGKTPSYKAEFRMKAKSGEWLWIMDDGKVTKWDKEGNPVRACGIHLDITKRKKAEEELKESKNKYRSLFLSMKEGVCLHEVIYDKRKKPVDYIILNANNAYEEILGIERDHIIGEKATDVYGTGDAPYIDIYEKVARTGKSISFDTYFTPLKKHFLISVFSYEKGKFATVFLDISDRIKSEEELKTNLYGIINTLASIVKNKDPYTAGHQKKVAKLAKAISEKLGLSEDEIGGIDIAAKIHDIGKLVIPASILSKPGKISDIEFEMIKDHSKTAYDMIKNIKFRQPVAKIVLQHHERLDGSGYPNGLKDKDIMLGAKIIAVSDVVEAMTSHRPYRPALGIDKALEEISTNKGVLYDSKVADACISIFKREGFKF